MCSPVRPIRRRLDVKQGLHLWLRAVQIPQSNKHDICAAIEPWATTVAMSYRGGGGGGAWNVQLSYVGLRTMYLLHP